MKVFGPTLKATPQLKSVEQLLLILLVTDILKISHRKVIVEEKEDSQFYLELVFNSSGEFNLMNEDCWNRIGI